MDPRITYYDQMLERYGPDSAQALAWRDDHSQQMRFQVLSEIADLDSATILDEGCGLGDLYPFLTARFKSVEYHGIDINEQLIVAAKKKYPDASFEAADFSIYRRRSYEYVLASGALSFRVPDAWNIYTMQIQKMYEISKKGVAFNFLNAKHFGGNDLYVTYTREEIFQFCSTFTDKIIVRDDYSSEDFTFYLYH